MSSSVNLLQPTYRTETYNNNSDMSSTTRVNATDDSLLGYTENGTSVVTGKVTADTNMFLQLLVAQMSNLDPFGENQDPTQYVTQLAQFSTLEQMQAMNSSLNNLSVLTNGLLVNSAVSTASNLLGKNAEFLTSSTSSETITGKVSSVYVEDGLVYFEVDIKDGEIKSIPYEQFVKVLA